jgi:hypothetical protein
VFQPIFFRMRGRRVHRSKFRGWRVPPSRELGRRVRRHGVNALRREGDIPGRLVHRVDNLPRNWQSSNGRSGPSVTSVHAPAPNGWWAQTRVNRDAVDAGQSRVVARRRSWGRTRRTLRPPPALLVIIIRRRCCQMTSLKF